MAWTVIRQQQESPEPIRNRQVSSPARENRPFWVSRTFLHCLSLEVGSYVTAIIGALWALLGALDGCLTLANNPSWDNAGLNIFRPQVPGGERFFSRNGTSTVPTSSGGGEYIVTPDLAPVALFLGVDVVQLIFCIGFGLMYCCVWHPKSLSMLRIRIAGRVALALVQVSSFATAAALIQTKQAAAVHDDRPSARNPGQGVMRYSVANAVVIAIFAALVNGFGVYTLMCINWALESDQKPTLEMGPRSATIERQPSLRQAERSIMVEIGNRGDWWAAPSTLHRSATLPSRFAPPSPAFAPEDYRLTRQYGTVSRMDGLRDVDRNVAGDWARSKPSMDRSRSLPRTWVDGRPISEERSEGATLSRIYPSPEGKYSIGSNQTDSLQRAVLGVMNRSNTLQSRSTNPSTLINEPGSFLALEPWRQNIFENNNLSSPINAYPPPPPIPGEHVQNTSPPQFSSVDRRRGIRLRSQSVDETRSATNPISPRSPNVSAPGTPSLSRRAPPPMASPAFMQRVHEQSKPPTPTESPRTPAGSSTWQVNTVESASAIRTFEVTTTPTFNAQPTPRLQDLPPPPPPIGMPPPAPVRQIPHVEFSSTVQTSEVPRRRYSEIYSTLDRSEYEANRGIDSLPRTDSRSRANDSLGRSDSQSRAEDSMGRSDSRSRAFDSLGRTDSRSRANDSLPRSEFSTYPRSDGYTNTMSPTTTMTRSEFAPTRSADTTLSRSEGQSTMSPSDATSDGGRDGYFGTRVTSGNMERGDGRRQSVEWEGKSQQTYNSQSSNAPKIAIADPLGAPSSRAHERQMKEAALHMAAEEQIWKRPSHEAAPSQSEGIKVQTKVIQPAVSTVPQVQTVVVQQAVTETSTVTATPQSTSPDTPNRPVISPHIDRASLMTQTTGTSGTGPAQERERQRRFGRVLEEGEEAERVEQLGIPVSGSSARTSDANPVDYVDTVSERDIYDAYDWTSQRDSTPDVSRTVSFASTAPGRGDVFSGQSPTPRPVGPNLTVPPKNVRRFQKDPLS
ncbi:hypothetical protein BJ742DRAFT_828179 [Cladochytrium replicatum]|nr:hypothetical protein BJ742DRAFT_828179 [Cladochytrium replicatum]